MPLSREEAVLTIAEVRKPRGKEPAQILFNERQQIFTLPPRAAAGRSKTASANALTARLADALKASEPVKVVLNPRKGVVQRITPLPATALRMFKAERPLEENPQKLVPIDVSAIDPTTFNIVDKNLKVPIFRLCTKIVPDYATAKAIFDFCAQQSCHLGGTPPVPPCIPFQYVIDGCYARAHQMRRIIISRRFGYCCEKVFSFAIGSPNVLSVQAAKWGGCCVTWWYHVAPLLRVRVKFGRFNLVMAMVIDPSMFDKPVLVSSWLGAQENKTCNPNAKVTSYSIQPGSAYAPANGGASFITDPQYTATEQTLAAYKTLTTCP
jgi:hypothetical protein